MHAIEPAPPPSLRTRVAVVSFAVGVGAILNALSEIGAVAYIAWMALAAPVLAVMALVSAGRVREELGRRRRAHAAARAWQLALTVGAILVLPALGAIHDLIDVARCRPQLQAAAWAHPDRPGPHLAAIRTGGFLTATWGYAYDDSGEIEKPCGTQSPEWLARAIDARLANTVDDCAMNLVHVVGPYYRWGED